MNVDELVHSSQERTLNGEASQASKLAEQNANSDSLSVADVINRVRDMVSREEQSRIDLEVMRLYREHQLRETTQRGDGSNRHAAKCILATKIQNNIVEIVGVEVVRAALGTQLVPSDVSSMSESTIGSSHTAETHAC